MCPADSPLARCSALESAGSTRVHSAHQRARRIHAMADDWEFPHAFRGYDKHAVDKALQELRREVIQANAQAAEATKEVGRLTAELNELRSELEESSLPSYAGLGRKLELVLRNAEEESTRLIGETELRANRTRTEVI